MNPHLRSSVCSPAADELHDLDVVALVELGARPRVAKDHFPVDLDGDAAGS
jgi:hypothetical protein